MRTAQESEIGWMVVAATAIGTIAVVELEMVALGAVLSRSSALAVNSTL